jgi:hypothetical protein
VISETGQNANMPCGIVASVSTRNSRARDEVKFTRPHRPVAGRGFLLELPCRTS